MIQIKKILAVIALAMAISFLGSCRKEAVEREQQNVTTAAQENSLTKAYFGYVDSNYTALHIVCGGEFITFTGTLKVSVTFTETKNAILSNQTYVSDLTGVSESGKVYTAKQVYKAHSVLNKNNSHAEWTQRDTYRDAKGNAAGELIYHTEGIQQSDGSIKLNITITNTCL